MRLFFPLVIVAVGLTCNACSKKEAAASEGGETAQATTASGDKIGVKECDDYLEKFEKCLKGMPEAGRPAMESAMKQNRDAWKDMAKEPATKAGLQMACKAALDGLAQNPACK